MKIIKDVPDMYGVIAGEIYNILYNVEIFVNGKKKEFIDFNKPYIVINQETVTYNIHAMNVNVYVVDYNHIVKIKNGIQCEFDKKKTLVKFDENINGLLMSYNQSIYTSNRAYKNVNLAYNVVSMKEFKFDTTVANYANIIDSYITSIVVDNNDLIDLSHNEITYNFSMGNFKKGKSLIMNSDNSIKINTDYMWGVKLVDNIVKQNELVILHHKYVLSASLSDVDLKPVMVSDGFYSDLYCNGCMQLLSGKNYVLSCSKEDILDNYSYGMCRYCLHSPKYNGLVKRFGIIYVVEFPLSSIDFMNIQYNKITGVKSIEEQKLTVKTVDNLTVNALECYATIMENNIKYDQIKHYCMKNGFVIIGKFILITMSVLEYLCDANNKGLTDMKVLNISF